ncbi:MAG: D-alanyl-D-alanine carboxypeptidase [Aestuariivirga sp.]|uniref:D-alanyl-D-alanine carboxypeptidase family protein n=1 Tax=Aestuariivirga sp. TaxID=2650926 RepID=UPI0025C43215|nr:D-alanyl-D-alanine carboxypeptidase family protein [Aestuariivirga sp.]MCA3560916.1 D-alanyl-D-alanine carboxypeptidase [Aestuariivirga sp.]
MSVQRFRNVAFILLAACLLLALPGTHQLFAQGKADVPYESRAEKAILIDARSGRVLFEKNADLAVPPASMSKLMTMIMVFEALKAGKLKLDQKFRVSEDAWRRGGASSGGSTMYAELNSEVALENLIKGVVVQSANDACIVIAENMAGSEQAFAGQMTKRAHELGAANATFKNATGLPEPGHAMSVRDLAILARYIANTFPEYYEYYSIPEFTWNKIRQQNRNPLLKDYPGADGMKTGYTREAGYGLIGSALRDGRRLIMVIAGLRSINDRKQEARGLLDWGFNQFRTVEVYAKGDRVGQARVWGGSARNVPLLVQEDVKVALTPQETERAEMKLSYTGPLLAPVGNGQKVGEVRFIVDGVTVAEVPVVTGGAVPAENSMWSRAVDSLFIMVFGS